MNDFDFDKFFADDLTKGFPIEFVEADWENLAARLDAVERGKRRRRFVLLAFPIAASLAFLLMAWSLWQMSGQVKSLHSELAVLRSASPGGVVCADTTFHHVSVIQYDTIYRTLLAQNGRWSLGSQLQGSGNLDSAGSKNTRLIISNYPARIGATRAQQDSITHSPIYFLPSDSLNANDEKLANRTLLDAPDFLPVKTPGLTYLRPNSLTEIASPSVHLPAKRPLAAMIFRLRPHNIAFGVTGGTVWPQVRGAQSSPGFTGGLAGQIAFGRHIRLTGEFRWSKVWLRLKNGDQNAALLPPVPPPTADDVLEYVQVRQPSWDYLLGLRYHLRPEQRLQPYLALAWAGATTLEQTLQYEFHNDVTETETMVELPYTEQHVFRSRWQIGLGAEWRVGKRLAFGSEAFWQKPIGRGGFLESPRLGLKANVFYFL